MSVINYKYMLYKTLRVLEANLDWEEDDVEKQLGIEFREFQKEYEIETYKPRVEAVLKYYPIPMVVGAIHDLYQNYIINNDVEEVLYSVADPNGKWNSPAEYDNWGVDTNPLYTENCFSQFNDYNVRKNWAQEAAVDYSLWLTDRFLSWGDVSDIQSHFRELGIEYGLLKEFEENGIC